MAVSLFPKCYKNTGILSKQTPTTKLFLFVLYCLLVLPIALPIDCGVGSIGPIELPINRFGGRYVIYMQALRLHRHTRACNLQGAAGSLPGG